MKIAFVADLHIEGKRLEDKKTAWNKTVDDMIKQGISYCLLLGDIFGSRNIGGREASTGTVFNAFMNPVQKLVAKNIGVIAFNGNHDMATASQKSSLETFKGTHITYINENQFVGEHKGKSFTIAVAPWSVKESRNEDLSKFLKSVKNEFKNNIGAKIFVGHLTVKGASLNSGISIFGSEYEVTQKQLDNLGADVVALGHIHKRQENYVGALCQNNFGEEGNPTGYRIYDTETNQSIFREIESPKYMTIDIPSDLELNDYKEWKGDINSYTKYRMKGDIDNELLTEILKNPNNSIEIVPEKISRSRTIEGVESGKTDIELLCSYLGSKKVSESDIARIKSLAEKLEKEALS